MTYQEAEAFIHAAVKFPAKPSLERMRILMGRLGNPQQRLKYIHIAGTNGKGSTAVMCAKVLQQAGYRVGLYTSPYVLEFRERFQVNGEMIPKETFAMLVDGLRQAVVVLEKEGVQINEFERNTALAFLYFSAAKCDVVCLETGLGGLYDATNVIEQPLVSVITAISPDHTAVLGNTLAEIAKQKAGIIKSGRPAVVYPLQNEDVLAVLMETCAQKQSTFILPNTGNLEIQECAPSGSVFVYGGNAYHIRLAGEHQIYNAVTAIEVLNQCKSAGFSISSSAVMEGLEQATIPARFECLSKHPYVIVDGGHNAQGAKVLKETLNRFEKMPDIAILGMMADKDYQEYLRLVAPMCQKIIAVPLTDYPRALPAEKLLQAAAPYCTNVTSCSLVQAIDFAAETLDAAGTLLIGGSLFLAGRARKTLMEKFGSR